jgi:mono/diheme cytochrome c family protein
MIAVVLTMLIASTTQTGWNDAMHSLTTLEYPAIRDMRRTVVIMPQKQVMRTPDSLTVPVDGWGDDLNDEALVNDREAATKTLKNPVEPDDASVARGEKTFLTYCIPCHGKSMAGDGPVAAMFMPPPDLLAEATRNRTDGYIFSYIRHGGVVMPRYGQMVPMHRAWDVVNYLRHMQKTSPR